MRGQAERSRQRGANRYTKIVASIFHAKYEAGQTHVDFERDEFIAAAARAKIRLTKNLGALFEFKPSARTFSWSPRDTIDSWRRTR